MMKNLDSVQLEGESCIHAIYKNQIVHNLAPIFVL